MTNPQFRFLGDLEPINKQVRDRTPDKRQVSWRWLFGSVLAGMTSLILMGGALLAAFEGRQQLADPAAIALNLDNGSADARNRATRGNRVGQDVEIRDTETNIMMISTVTREGDANVVKVRPFMYLNAPLAVAINTNPDYPKFNALTVFSESSKPEPISASSDQIYGADVESEVKIQSSPFPYAASRISSLNKQRATEIEDLVRRASASIDNASITLASFSRIDPDRFSITEQETTIAPGITIRSENVSVANAISPKQWVGKYFDDRIIRIRSDAGLRKVLVSEDMDEAEAGLIEQVLSSNIQNGKLKRGDAVRLTFEAHRAKAGEEAEKKSINRISVYRGPTHLVSIARSDENNFVYAPEPPRPPQLRAGFDRKPIVTTTRLPSAYDGINRAAISEGMTTDLAQRLVRIFAFDVDFKNAVSPTDELSVLLSLEEGSQKPSKSSEILYASIRIGSVLRKYYRYRDPETGRVDYYDATGKSAKKFLLRKPVPNGRFRSPFGMRRHPISRIRKMHWGADWAAPRGTPIIAAGNGIVEHAKWAGGYGKQTVIRHANGYKTSYSHQTRYAKGIKAGARVRQGQIIGYVGTTGYSTGPHLHYEVSVNGNKVDPMRIRLPKGKVLKDQELAAFEVERQRIDDLIKRQEDDPTRLALN